jgi:hypothetical protein
MSRDETCLLVINAYILPASSSLPPISNNKMALVSMMPSSDCLLPDDPSKRSSRHSKYYIQDSLTTFVVSQTFKLYQRSLTHICRSRTNYSGFIVVCFHLASSIILIELNSAQISLNGNRSFSKLCSLYRHVVRAPATTPPYHSL